MILLTSEIEDFDRFVEVFSTKGAAKRKEHGSKGSTLYRDPNDEHRVWAVFDWDEEGFQSFVSDPEMAPILEEGGVKGRPQLVKPADKFDS